jgi:type I restriction enzyme S subunit
MSDWVECEFGDLFSHVYRYPTYFGIEYVDFGVKEIRGALLTKEGRISGDCRYITQETANKFPRVKLLVGDVVMSVRGTLGKIGIATEAEVGGVITANLLRLSPKAEISSSWLLQILKSDYFVDELENVSSQTTIKTIQIPELSSIRLKLPPIAQQQKIAKILSTVDNLIEKTQTLIDKYTAIKQGMMADLLTRGIDMTTGPHCGKLRPSVEDAPDLYKQTELGWVPKEWEVGLLNDFLKNIEQGWSPDCETEPANAGQWGVLKTTAVVWGGFNPLANKALPINLKPRCEYEITHGDVLMTRAGPGNRVGVVSYVDNTQARLMLSDKLYRVMPSKLLNKEYLALLLSSDSIQGQLNATKTGLAESQSNISQDIVKKLNIKIPQVNEQKLVVERIKSMSKKINAEKKFFDKLNFQKKGLMQDLLTGKVKVQ